MSTNGGLHTKNLIMNVGSLVIVGLPSVTEIDELLRKLQEGSIDFGGALDGSNIM